MNVLADLLSTFVDTLHDVLPIALTITGFQVFVLRRPFHHLGQMVMGFLAILIGMSLFLVGLELALFPAGRMMARQLSSPDFIADVHDWVSYYWVYVFAMTIGFATTVAEPALIAVAIKAHHVSGGAIQAWPLRVAVGLGVGAGLTLGTIRIVTGMPLYYLIIGGYVVVMIQTLLAPRQIIALAYDSGGVTTSTITVPIVTALGLGLAEQVPGRSALLDGFGLIAFASLFPIISVLAYAQFAEWRRRHRQPG